MFGRKDHTIYASNKDMDLHEKEMADLRARRARFDKAVKKAKKEQAKKAKK